MSGFEHIRNKYQQDYNNMRQNQRQEEQRRQIESQQRYQRQQDFQAQQAARSADIRAEKQAMYARLDERRREREAQIERAKDRQLYQNNSLPDSADLLATGLAWSKITGDAEAETEEKEREWKEEGYQLDFGFPQRTKKKRRGGLTWMQIGGYWLLFKPVPALIAGAIFIIGFIIFWIIGAISYGGNAP